MLKTNERTNGRMDGWTGGRTHTPHRTSGCRFLNFSHFFFLSHSGCGSIYVSASSGSILKKYSLYFFLILPYLMRKFPLRWICGLRLDGDLVPLFSCDNWLALVRGKRGDGFPVPGRTGGVHTTTTLWNAQHQISTTNKPMAMKAFILGRLKRGLTLCVCVCLSVCVWFSLHFSDQRILVNVLRWNCSMQREDFVHWFLVLSFCWSIDSWHFCIYCVRILNLSFCLFDARVSFLTFLSCFTRTPVREMDVHSFLRAGQQFLLPVIRWTWQRKTFTFTPQFMRFLFDLIWFV